MYRQRRFSRQSKQKNFRRSASRSSSKNGSGFNKSFDPRTVVNTFNKVKYNEPETYIIKNEFSDFDLNERLLKNILNHGFKKPTVIQDQTIPVINSGKDVVGIANTGTGKTAAFLIPLINKTILNKNSKVLILSPTRELASQINSEFVTLALGTNIFSAICIGGVPIRKQIMSINRSPNFLIGTPGRILDLINRNIVDLSQYDTIVLDEVDRMLDMGFVHDINKISALLPTIRQSLFFSATMNSKVSLVMPKFVNNPVMITVKTNDNKSNIKQDIVELHGRDKPSTLIELLNKEEVDKTLIFMRTKRSANNMQDILFKVGIKTVAMHGNKSQRQRQQALEQFRRGNIKILIATDVAARGLDVDDITHVINYDLPESYEMYIHRIGRTGRADKKGVAITLVN